MLRVVLAALVVTPLETTKLLPIRLPPTLVIELDTITVFPVIVVPDKVAALIFIPTIALPLILVPVIFVNEAEVPVMRGVVMLVNALSVDAIAVVPDILVPVKF